MTFLERTKINTLQMSNVCRLFFEKSKTSSFVVKSKKLFVKNSVVSSKT